MHCTCILVGQEKVFPGTEYSALYVHTYVHWHRTLTSLLEIYTTHTISRGPLITHYIHLKKGGCASQYLHTYLQVDADRVEYTYWVGSCPPTTLPEVYPPCSTRWGYSSDLNRLKEKPILLPIQLLQCSPG